MRSFYLVLLATSLLYGLESWELKEGSGKALVKVACTQCHNERTITPNRGDREDWKAIINLMYSYGLPKLTPEKKKIILNYLSVNYNNTIFLRRKPIHSQWDKINF
jgi:hypothetical protein